MAKKVDVETAVFKALDQAPLSLEEAIALTEQDHQTLSEEYELSMFEINKVSEWFKSEAVRLISQNQIQPGVLETPAIPPGLVEEGRKITLSELNEMIINGAAPKKRKPASSLSKALFGNRN